jgi:hypothetical protein
MTIIGQYRNYDDMKVKIIEDTYPKDVLVQLETGDNVTVPMSKLW